ncbi:MAG: aldehyde dehydrogenase family protein [Lentisphaerae bacterium]|nr:aldehyde dehydrogenase family protein [Lentisphaerota bacterium]
MNTRPDNGPMLTVTSPFDQEPVTRLPYDQGSGLEARIANASETAERWRDLPFEERILRVQAGVTRFLDDGEKTAMDVTRQMGKPLAQSRNEINTVRERAEYMLSIAPEALRADTLPPKDGFHRRIEHVPLGIVFNIAAWNYPLVIPVNVIVPALVAGNVVLLKHSARTPLSGQAFETAFQSADMPGLVTNLVLTHEDAAQLVSDPRIAHVAFTGSVEGGIEIYRRASSHCVDVGLELGGKDPAYVADDADLAFSVENIVDGACYNAGQSCCAVERVYVHRNRYDEFVERAKTLLEEYQMGDPMDDATTLGPLARAAALDELEAQVEDAVGRKAQLLLGGERSPDTAGNFFPPTLIAELTQDAAVMQEESFGPILPVMAVQNDEEALRHMNDTRFGLTASVWTRDNERAEHFAAHLNAGTIFQNRCDYLDPALPWTGVKDSGKGSTLSRYGFLHLTRRKSIHFRRS